MERSNGSTRLYTPYMMKRLLLAAILALAMAFSLKAQEDYRFDAGGGIGMTGYLGDANTSNLW